MEAAPGTPAQYQSARATPGSPYVLAITLSVAVPGLGADGIAVDSSSATLLGMCGAVMIVGDLTGTPLVCELGIWITVAGGGDAIVDLLYALCLSVWHCPFTCVR